ncbi:threonine/serine exporter family protein [Rhodococcus sp. X156]|uniref:threonine/serine ThrE exporter family protein n=1 Tax=Rhodococcus sp. X156 TaxID=2499145 RepID=UPI000FD889DB|nr:threonine/serine exporter family protein [Rhodococcus sp. X156]
MVRQKDPSTVQFAAPAQYPTGPAPAFTGEAAIAEVLDLALRVGEVLLSSGAATADVTADILTLTSAYGLPRCEVDITYTAITISAHRGLSSPPVNTMRVVNYRSLDYTRLADVDRVICDAEAGALSAREAHQALDKITTAPHPYPRWVSTLAWAGMAASIAVLVGGEWLVALVALLSAVVIDRTRRVLNRTGLPGFFQQVVGGFIATLPAALLYAVQDPLHLTVRPSQVAAAGVIVLLSGLSLVGSMQDAITGAMVTAAARFTEVLMLTAGIIVGVGLALKFASGVGVDLPPLLASTTSLSRLPVQVLGAAAAAGFFALACYAERRALAFAAAAGAVGFLAFGLLSNLAGGTLMASGAAAAFVGFAGGVLSRRYRVPPLVIAVSGITPLLPGLAVYRGLYAMTNDDAVMGLSEMSAALATGAALAAGVVFGEWLAKRFRTTLAPRLRTRSAA